MMLKIDDWESSGGIYCRSCGAEVVRLVEGRCPQCHHAMTALREEKVANRVERRYLARRLREGDLSLQDLREGRL